MKIKVSRRVWAIVLIVAVFLGGGLIWIRYRNRTATTAGVGILNIATVQVERGDISVLVSGNGTVQFYENEEIKPNIEGEIIKLNVEEGDEIKQGDVIAEIDSSIALASAETNKKSIENKIKLQEVVIDGLEKDLSDLISIKNNLKVVAPFSGILSSLSVEVGDSINADQKVGILEDNSQFRIVLPFEKEKVEGVEPGQKVDVYLTDYVDKRISSQGEVKSIAVYLSGEEQEIVDVEVIVEGKAGYESGVNASFALEVNGDLVPPLETGTLEVINSIPLISQGSGKVVNVLKKEGDLVEEGEVIFELENEDIDLDIQKAQYNLESAKIELEDLKNQLLEAQEYIEDLKADSVLLSPVDGVVSELYVESGDQVSKTTVVAQISTSKLVIPVNIDELDIGKVEVGQTANITFDAVEDQIFSGTVEHIALGGTNQNGVGVFEVLIGIDNIEGIKPGMSANVEILVEESKDTLLLPIEAVQKIGDQYMVMLKTEDETAEVLEQEEQSRRLGNMKAIQIGLVNETYVEVIEGLEEGDQVIVAGQSGDTGQTQMRVPGMQAIPGGRMPGGATGGSMRNNMGPRR